MNGSLMRPTESNPLNASGSRVLMPDGSRRCSTLVSPENADVSTFCNGLLLSSNSRTLDVPANAYPSTLWILLCPRRMAVMFWRPAKANCATVESGVCWMDSSRRRGRPRNAKGLIVLMLLPSSESLRRWRSPVNASLRITGKWFLVSDRCSTEEGNIFSGISVSPPVLHKTCNNVHSLHNRYLRRRNSDNGT